MRDLFYKLLFLKKVHLRIPAEKINIIPSGIDLSAVMNESKEESRLHLGWKKDRMLFGLVGRFDVLKGHELVIEAMKQCDKKDFDVFFG